MPPRAGSTAQSDMRRTGISTGKFFDERFLLSRLHGIRAVVLPDPSDGLAGWKSAHDCEAGQGGSGSPMASEATQLNSDSTTSTVQQRSQGGPHWNRITGYAEIGPVEVIVKPRRIP